MKKQMKNTMRFVFRWVLFLVGIWIIQANVIAQISEGGVPPGFQFQTVLRSRTATVQVPVAFNVSELIKADEQQNGQGKPLLSVATLIDVQYSPDNAGSWTMLPDGRRLWQLNLQAKDAIALMVYYSDFYIPAGGKLYIYNVTKSHILGAYTEITNPQGGRFATEFVAGDDITLEYVSASGGEMPRIEIEAIGYGYNHLHILGGAVSLRKTSDPCEVDVNCEEGNAWQNQKKGVCYMTQRIGNRTFLCTGSLMNNTAQDLKPYILTAHHCACDNDKVASPEDMRQWIFYFNHELEVCGNSASAMPAKTIVGCRKVAETTINGQSDGLLVLVNTPIPSNYNVYYNGWDRRNTPAKTGVSIHHPQGDYKKISTFYAPAIHYTLNTGDGFKGDTNAHWNVVFDETANGHGVTEDGSSGCPLFNENKLIVGTLSGGSSTCGYPEGLNIYGKFNYHWDKYKTHDSTRMDVWLDPVRSGVETLNGRYHQSQMPSPLNLKAVYQNQTVILTWQAPASVKPLKYNVYNNNLKIGESVTLTYTHVSPQFGTQTYSVSAVYEGGDESDFTNVTISIMEYKAPVDVSVTYTASQQQVAIQWEPPVYEQTIYWGESNAMYQITLNKTIPFYFGQMWTTNDIRVFHKKTITAVKFIPIRNNSYEIYIVQGKRTYRQQVINPVSGQTNTIQLITPFVIDGEEDLIVSFYITKLSPDNFPAVCDGGPAVQGKGNIYSYDGKSWLNLYDDIRNPEDYNYNFFLAAVVSSVEKDIPLTDTKQTGRNSLEVSSLSTEQSIGSSFNLSMLASELRKTALPEVISLRSVSPAAFPEAISLRSVSPAAFPEVSVYYIYRDNVRIATVPPIPRRYLDNKPTKETFYQVSGVYNGQEGQKSAPVSVRPVGNQTVEQNEIRLYPTTFTNQVELSGHERISRLEIYSVTGRLSLLIEKPARFIHTGSLQPGVYIFRMYTGNHSVTVLRGVKVR